MAGRDTAASGGGGGGKGADIARSGTGDRKAGHGGDGCCGDGGGEMHLNGGGSDGTGAGIHAGQHGDGGASWLLPDINDDDDRQ